MSYTPKRHPRSSGNACGKDVSGDTPRPQILAAVARVKGVKEDTVSSWLKKAATHVEKIEEVLLKEYHVDKAQMDSLWTYVGNKGKKGGTKRNRIKVLSGVER
jgi:hypothetical protein